MLLQHVEDLSYRETERYIKENVVARWFCGFSITDKTPDHSFLTETRDKFGLENLKNLFNQVVERLREKKIVSDTFTFVDTTAIVSKVALWEERDQAIKDGHKTLNNEVVAEYAYDKEARWGAKGKKKYWFGYKNAVAVDMKEGIITKIEIDPANETDTEMFFKVCPESGAVLADKIFDIESIQNHLEGENLHSMIIKKNNRRDKNRDLDSFISKLRGPYEGIFTHFRKKKNDGGYVRTHQKGEENVHIEMLLKALGSNIKRIVRVIDEYIKVYGEAYEGYIVF